AQCMFSAKCTTDTCDTMTNMCVEKPIPGCCQSNADCNDHDACTADSCNVSTGTCSNTQISGCCLSDGDCNDDNACTVDSCDQESHTCTSTPVPGCCATNADCQGACMTCDSSTHTCMQGTCSDAGIGGDAGFGGDGGRDGGTGSNGLDLSGGGCACDTSGRGSPAGGIVLALALAAIVLRRRRASATLLVAAVALAASARADAQGFDAQLYQPATSSTGYLTQESGAVLPRGELDIGAVFDFARDPLVARDPSTGDELMNGGIVENRLGMQIVAGYGALRWLEVGVALPFVLAQSGDLTLVDSSHQLSTTALGDMRAFGKAQIWTNGFVQLAGAVDVTLPTGDSSSFTGGTSLSAWPRVILGWTPGALSIAVNAGFRFQQSNMVANATVGDEFTAGAGASYALRPDKAWLLAEAYLAVDTDGGAHDVPAEALVGARAVVAGPWRAQVAIGEGLGRGVTSPELEAVASMSYVAAAKPRIVVEQPLDTDGDGIPDTTDACPREPEDKDGFQDADGCPDPDNDLDGIPDAKDKCPNEAEDHDGFQDADGCPDPDNDLDGIADGQDKCPNDPETKNGYQDSDGCPDELPEPVKKFVGVVKGVNFKTGSADLLPGSAKALDGAVKTLQEFPDLQLEIQGHTDDVPMKPGGKYADNEDLSAARAESVRSYLSAMGVSPTRLVAKGYGSSRPIIDPEGLTGGKLRDARAKNRRVEFQIVVAP
ncbi:MAG TPA: OmpA family protein, partial [Kofleriaceae bacterium]|nr:OmpA family protein [Kofleriaceae bacterium]